MRLQTIQLNGREYVLIPRGIYASKKNQIDKLVSSATDDDEYIPFKLEDFFQNEVTLARMKAGVTQEKLAQLLGVSQSYISKLESEETVSAAALFKIKEALKDYPDRWKSDPSDE
jgi:DNA-binding XRE family transcriptional regulator